MLPLFGLHFFYLEDREDEYCPLILYTTIKEGLSVTWYDFTVESLEARLKQILDDNNIPHSNTMTLEAWGKDEELYWEWCNKPVLTYNLCSNQI
jgi:hypothetical protein